MLVFARQASPRTFWFFLCWLLLTSVLRAHNGSVVVTSVVENIVADGDFSDWPQDIAWHPVGLNLYGDAQSSADDCDAKFCVGVDPNTMRLYVCLKVADDSFVKQPKGYSSWESWDHPTFHIAPPVASQNKEGASSQSSMNFSVVHRFDVEKSLLVTECVADLHDVGYEDLSSALAAAFTVGYNDKDKDGSFSVWFWSPEVSKDVHRSRRGDLIICGPKRGTLVGNVKQADIAKQLGTLMLEFEGIENPLLKFTLRTKKAGKYEIDLPPGRYRRSGENILPTTIQVSHGKVANDTIEVQSLEPQRFLLSDFDSLGQTRPGYSQLLSKASADTPYYEMTKLNGLPDSNIGALAQDSFGALWIGTHSNLARYDGSQLRVYDSKLIDIVRDMWHDAENDRLWAVGRGVGYVSEGQFTKFPFPSNRAHCVGPTHHGKVCIGTIHGLYYWDGEAFSYHSEEHGLPDRIVKSIAADKRRGVTWIGTNQGLAAFDGESYQVFDQHHGLTDPRIVSLFVDSRGTLWIGTSTSIFRYDDEFLLVRKHESERISYGRSFTELEDGTIYAACYDGTVRIPPEFPIEPPTVEPISTPSNSVLLDRDMQLWNGFENGGLRRTDLGLQHICRLYGRCNFLYSIGDYLWFLQKGVGGSEAAAEVDPHGTVVRYHKRTGDIEQYPIYLNDENETPVVTNLYAESSGVSVGTESHGIFQLSDANWIAVDLPVDSYSQVVSLCRDGKDRLWIATTKGLYVLESGEVTTRNIPVRPGGDFLHVTPTPDGFVAVGTSEGVFIMDNEKVAERFDESNGLVSNRSDVIGYDREGTLWMTTHLGLQGISGKELEFYDTNDGLLDNRPTRFLTFWGDEIWCGSHAGINRISKTQKIVQHILGTDGLGSNGIYGVVHDGDTMWLAGDAGLWQYRRGKHPPRIAIDDVTTDRSLGPRKTIAVTTDLDSIDIDFHANSLKNRPGGMLYQYRLKGHKNEWTTISETKTTVPIPPVSGSFEFEVKATDRDLLTSETQRLAVEVTPPYARLATQIGLVAVSIACVILGSLYFVGIRKERDVLEQRVEERTAQLTAMERQLQQSQKMEALGTLATGVAHDFNNSLLAISGNAELGLMTDSLDEKNELLTEVLAVTEQAAALTQSMLMFGGKTSSEKRNVDVRDAIWQAEKMLRRTLPASIEFSCIVPAHPVYCRADIHQLVQLVLNLSLNARDALLASGRLDVELLHEAGKASLFIRDDGHGMSEATQERIFEPFYTEKTRGKGTGLGLSVVHAIVRDHAGEIRVESSVGNGAEFCVSLPTTATGENSNAPPFPDLPKCRGKILIADDEAQVRHMLVQALLQAGYEVENASNGIAFVERFSKVGDFDLVIVDVDMPGMNGWQGLDQIRRLRNDVAAIVISGLPSERPQGDESTVFLRKPFSLRELVNQAARMSRK